MRHCPFCDKKCVNFGIKLDAEISIWMQSGYDGYDFSATLLMGVPRPSKCLQHHQQRWCKILWTGVNLLL